ncbi:hypothetical protein ABMA28_008274 [Loxostege sticticalis]|uniref:DUF7869 domain-containing protein n=1 Tax=Loxostege sticticalis TaxID=481309 RepID=A0ABD0SHB5_LOXSC
MKRPVITGMNDFTCPSTSAMQIPSTINGSSDSTKDSYDSTDEEDSSIVGKRGIRKKRPLPKKLKERSERWSGKGKCVKPNPCLGKKCGNDCANKFTEIERNCVHELYWGLGSLQRQRDFILSCIKDCEIRRKRAESNRRKISYGYYLPKGTESVKVCQQFLLKTLDISQMTLRYTKSHKIASFMSKSDQRGKSTPSNKYSQSQTQNVNNFIKKLPAVQSHYCRNKSNKLYLPTEFRDVAYLYRNFYLKDDDTKELGAVSYQKFRKIFKTEFNLGFHLPKKDKCDQCERIKNLSDEERKQAIDSDAYKNHIKDKERSLKLFLEDQKRSKDNRNFLCASFDLEKVLTTPHGQSVNFYYTRKLAYYNESIYESGTRSEFCYLWNETEAKRGCNEICTVIFKYLKMVDERRIQNVIALYCDSCAGQNKNKAMIVMLYYFMQHHASFVESLTINFLIPGHTMMPVDSVHATIEGFVQKRTIYAPSEWQTLIGNARTNPKKYDTILLNNNEIKDWNSYASAFLPNKIKIQTSKLRNARFEKGDKFYLKYDYDGPEQAIDVSLILRSRQNQQAIREPKTAYTEKIPISKAKYEDLKKMCEKGIIPEVYAKEYLDLPCDRNTRDVLPETDEDDE